MSPPVRWLGGPGSTETGEVGGKVAYLSRLAGDFAVPPGFCLVCPPGYVGASLGVRSSIFDAYRELGDEVGRPDPPVAVRSSAGDEDGAAASFAGVHETFLNVTGSEAVADAVDACAASFAGEAAREYRRGRGLADRPASAAVLVQHLVVADVSGVVFSLDPVTGGRDRIVVNASWGMGESVVGGTVTPDLYVVRRSDLRVVNEVVATKRAMTVVVPGGVSEVAVPGRMQGVRCLDEEAVVGAARLALDVEARMGWPVDLEVCWSGGELYLLQCRPVTAVAAAAAGGA